MIAITIIVIPLTLLTIVFGELIPKVFALRNKEWVCLRLSPWIEWFSISVWPIVWVLERTVTLVMRLGERHKRTNLQEEQKANETALQELRAVASLARTSLLIGGREEAIILNAARLASTKVAAIMLPAKYIGMLNVDDPLADCLVAAHQDMHTRFPVTEGAADPQKIIGYVNFKDIVAVLKMSPQEPNLRGILRTIPRFPADMTVANCLEQLTHERVHIALITEASGTVVGMLTLEDILEELIGEIHDEFDRLPANISRSGQAWVVGGHASLERVREVTGIELPPHQSDSTPPNVSDWVIHQLGHPVAGGEVVPAENARVVVRKVRRQRVLEALISKS